MQIEIGGKSRGIKFNQLALEELIKSNLSGMDGIGATYTIVHAGLVGSSFVKREEPDYSFEDVSEWVDELNSTKEGVKVITDVIAAFVESTAYKNAIPKEVLRTEDDKKKVHIPKKKR
jgi:hypothetical protein